MSSNKKSLLVIIALSFAVPAFMEIFDWFKTMPQWCRLIFCMGIGLLVGQATRWAFPPNDNNNNKKKGN
jgi:xanthine/uracil permease